LGEFHERLQKTGRGEKGEVLSGLAEKLEADVATALNDDLNAPRAVAALFDFVRAANRELDKPVAPTGTARAVAAFERVTGVLDVLPTARAADPAPMTRGVCCQGMFRGARGAVGCPSGQREQTVNLPRLALRRFESFPHHFVARGRSSVGRASAFQAEGHGFEPRRPLLVLRAAKARVAQSVERVLGKDEVTGSIPVASSGNEELVKKRALTKEYESNGKSQI